MPSRLEAAWLGLLFVLAALLFSLWPELDLALAARFYVAGEGFRWGQSWWAEGVYWLVWYGSRVALITVFSLWLLGLFARRGWLAARRRWFGFLALAFALGPGLITDQLLKNHWGRARPHQIVQFGGDKAFTPALLPSAQCARNCAFVSGHATGAYALMSLGWLAAAPRRRRWLWVAALSGLGVGFVRMVQGGHFASDVVFAFYAVWLGNMLAWALLRLAGKLPPAEGIPARLA